MSDKFDRLVSLLRELFQLDQPDLDFGLYRIMHAKSGEVTQFLEKDLLPQVKKAFEQYQPADKAAIKKKLGQAVAAAESLGVDPDTNEKVLQLRAELAEGADLEVMQSEVYDHLYSFFRRYYSEGDFLAKRVYKPGVYAVPYEGEEVVLHWANKDQYYIKTSEYLRDYAFRLKPDAGDAGGDPMRIHFRLVAAAEGEHGNNKAAEGKDRVFILAPAGESGHDFLSVETVDGREELVIGFEYRPATMDDWTEETKAQATAAAKKKPPKQKDLIDIAVKAVLATTGNAFDGWITELAKPHTKVNGETAEYSRLEGHLSRYCARHTFDYFIHKDLGGFLRRELDFYIKNEVMHLDDVQDEDAPKVEQYISKIKVIRTIAGKVIDFLTQVEEFQKKLWLKKKFVTETFYCIQLGVIPKALYPTIAANEAQREEWVDQCGIDRIEASLSGPGYSEPLSVDFLENHPSLMVDTRHFEASFVHELIAGFGTLDDWTDGILVHSENFQALSLMQARLKQQVQCVYIDPPYNSKTTEILYKNTYKHASWLSLMASRLQLSSSLSSTDGSHVIAIDENEQEVLGQLIDMIFPSHDKTCVAVMHNKKGIQGSYFSYNHEYCFFALSPNLAEINGTPVPEEDWEYDNLRKWGRESERETARNCFYPIYVEGDQIAGFGDVCNETFSPESANVAVTSNRIAVYPVDPKGIERKWRYARDSVEKILPLLRVHATSSGEVQIHKAKATKAVKTIWDDPRYIAGDYGTRWLSNLGVKVSDTLYPKSLHTVEDSIFAVSGPEATILDYFGGSGTTAHATILLNRKDGGSRRFIVVEMGSHFDSVLLPRTKKIAYTAEWRDGQPVSEPSSEEAKHAPRVVKVLRLESYEDALNNLALNRTEAIEMLLGSDEGEHFAEEYRLKYMLDVESRGSTSLLSVGAFLDPTAYRLSVKAPGVDESYDTAVDLVETFNWLLGLRVAHIGEPQSFFAAFERDNEGRLGIKGRIKSDPHGPWWFRTITGVTPDGRRVLIIWRKRAGGEEPEGIEQDNAVLDAWFRTTGYSTSDSEFDIVWVNGDSNLANLRQDEASEHGLGETGWKVRVIEDDFRRLMFESEDSSW